MCSCQDGYSGTNCEVDLDFCNTTSCQNGTCFEASGTMTFCLCVYGYGGSTCQNDLNFCRTSSCQNDGLCVEGQGSQTSCDCPVGFTGAACSVAIDTPLISCPFEEDQVWMLSYMETPIGETVPHPCSMIYNTPGVTGIYYRGGESRGAPGSLPPHFWGHY